MDIQFFIGSKEDKRSIFNIGLLFFLEKSLQKYVRCDIRYKKVEKRGVKMKFVHIADMHFDSAFSNLSDKDIMGDLRRLEQRKVFKKIIEYIKQNGIEYLFISGDLYEHKYIKQSTIEYINNLFKEIPETKIFIAAGNHDPKVKNSYYNKFNWNPNVRIFDSFIEKVEEPECNIYGYSFDEFYCNNSGIEDFIVEQNGKPNILVIHGNLDGVKKDDKPYNPISKKMLLEKGFDYVALGHIHKPDYENQKIVYPGSTVSLGFDELGKHGMIVGNLSEDLKIEFVPLDDEEFTVRELNVDNLGSKEELIETINGLNINSNEYVEIILTGGRNFEIDKYDIFKYVQNDRIIKIKDETKIARDLEKIANESTLRGLFVKEMLEKLKNEEDLEKKDILEKAVEIGLDALE